MKIMSIRHKERRSHSSFLRTIKSKRKELHTGRGLNKTGRKNNKKTKDGSRQQRSGGGAPAGHPD